MNENPCPVYLAVICFQDPINNKKHPGSANLRRALFDERDTVKAIV